MSVNFLNNSAIMFGGDLHEFYQTLPGPPYQMYYPLFLYLVGAPFAFWPATFWNRTSKVTADAEKMIDVDFSLLLVPHMWVPPLLPGFLQFPKHAEIIATSGSEVSLGIGSVTGEGDPLAACFAACIARNLNCWTSGDHPSGHVICICSVKTKPSLLDYALGILKWIAVGFLGELAGGKLGGALGRKIARIPQSVWEFLVKQAVINAIEQVAELIRYIARKFGY